MSNSLPFRLSPCGRGEGEGCQIHDLGLRDYAEVLEFQHRLVGQRLRGGPDHLILVEHAPVLTRGRAYNGRTLGNSPLPIFDIERGGDITYHGPGQLVGYPILHLKERGLLVGRYLRLLEQALMDAVEYFGIQAQRLKGFTGVWASGKKLASIGVAVKGWVAYHGFALNVSTDLSAFHDIHPCGLEPSQMTSLEQLLSRAVPMQDAKQAVLLSFRRHLDALPQSLCVSVDRP